MLCSEVQLFRHGDGFEDVKPLPCNRWTCEYCQPRRRRRLLAIAASGEPNKFLTLTINPGIGASPLDRRNLLHDAWTRLVKRIVRQWALPPERRWKLVDTHRRRTKEIEVRRITARTPQRGCDRLPYMVFIERTKAGEPHLHILLRCPYIPQDWLAEQMSQMLASPICDIRAVASTRAAITYVTKYVTKEPAQFGTRKRYWVSKGWEVNRGDQAEDDKGDRLVCSVRRVRWADSPASGGDPLRHVEPLADGWFRVWHRKTPWDRWGQRDPTLCSEEGPCRPVVELAECPS